MRIIKQGCLPGDRLYQRTCSKCATVFEFQRSEATYVSDQRDGEYLVIKCPLCNTKIHTNTGGYVT